MNSSKEEKELKTKEGSTINNYIINNSKFKSILKKNKSSFIENFELLNFIGTGSESEVYKAKIIRYNKIVALKMISVKKDEEKNDEIKISKKLKNQNIINFYLSNVIKKNKVHCIMMEYAKYGNLRDFENNFLEKNNLSESFLCFITSQILNGLKYIHSCKITHYDLKPQNIIIDDYLNVKIIDFSVSLDYSKINSNKIKLPFRGTSFYMSPEVIRNDTINIKDLNKIDLYSLGVILYNLAFGSYPFKLNQKDIKKYDKIYKKIMKDLIINNIFNYYSPHFIDFIKKLLEKDINKRININEALNDYWIKGAEILFNEKEKINNAGIFLSYLVTDHIKNFYDYIHKIF